jgi:tetrahydromethanopterin S-methyltransferase subunit G
MLIANPIYDVFFKFLMEDTEVAKKLLSTIIGENIVALEMNPQKTTIQVPKYYLSVIRMDFKATIQLENSSYKNILIELQKGKYAFDIARFRKYLGENYAKEDRIRDEQGVERTASLPIITIYFLGFRLDNIPTPVVKANHQYYDVINEKALDVKNDFIEQLIHDCFVVQIPRLTVNQQSKIENMLLVFNQQFVLSEDPKKLVIPQQLVEDQDVKLVTERLSKPLLSEDMLRQADVEEDIEEKLDDLNRKIEEKEQVIHQQDQMLEEKDQMLEEKDQMLEAKDREIAELRRHLKTNKDS